MKRWLMNVLQPALRGVRCGSAFVNCSTSICRMPHVVTKLMQAGQWSCNYGGTSVEAVVVERISLAFSALHDYACGELWFLITEYTLWKGPQDGCNLTTDNRIEHAYLACRPERPLLYCVKRCGSEWPWITLDKVDDKHMQLLAQRSSPVRHAA